MAKVKCEPGFTQLTKLNILDARKLTVEGAEVEVINPDHFTTPIQASFDSINSFSMAGNHTEDFQIGRRVQLDSGQSDINCNVSPEDLTPDDIFTVNKYDYSIITAIQYDGIKTDVTIADPILTIDLEEASVDINWGNSRAGSITTTELINSSQGYPSDFVLETSGFTSAGDGGNAGWMQNGVIAQTPSQSSSQLGEALLNDASGNQWGIVDNNVNIKALGGLSGDIADYISAAESSSLSSVLISNNVTCGLTQQNAQLILKYINKIKIDGFLSFTVGDLEINLTDFIDINNESATKMDFQGVSSSNIDITGFNAVTGSVGNYLVTLNITDTSNVETGHYLLVNPSSLAGTGRFAELTGVWKITAKTAGTVTIKHTHQQSSFPTMTVTGTMRPLKSILRWDTGSRGLAVYNCDLNSITNIVIAGSYDISVTPPSDGPEDGLLVGDQSNTPETGSTQSRSVFYGSVFLNRVGVVEWPNNGLQCIGGSVMTNGYGSCSNGWRGSQSAGNGFVNTKFSSSSGNGASGYEAEAGGVLNAAGSIAAGNAEQGVYVIGGGNVIFSSSAISAGNKTNGIDARDGGTITANTAISLNNTVNSVKVSGGFITCENGEVDGIVISENSGAIELNGATSTATYTIDNGSKIKLPSGNYYEIDWADFPSLPTLTNVAYTDDGTSATFNIANNICHWKIKLKFTALDTADTSSFVLTGLPVAMEQRIGNVAFNVRTSTGILMAANETFRAEYNSSTDSVVIVDASGGLMGYNDGQIQAAGLVEFSGWYQT